MRRTTIFIAAMALFITACGGGDGSDSEYRDLIAGQFLAQGEAEGALVFTDAEADCAAAAIVADLGVTRLTDMGYDPETGAVPNGDFIAPELNAGDKSVWFAAIDGCVDLQAEMAGVFEDFGLDADVAACVAEAYFASGLLENALLSEDYDAEMNDQIDAVIGQAITDCGG